MRTPSGVLISSLQQSSIWDSTFNYTIAKRPSEVYARVELKSFSSSGVFTGREYQLVFNQTALLEYDADFNKRHQGLAALIVAKRLIELLDSWDTCSSFKVIWAPIIAILGLVLVGCGALYVKKRYAERRFY